MNNHHNTVILGGGLSGLTVAHKLRQKNPKHSYIIVEKNGRTGGVIRSHRDRGFITEIGPHGFLDNCEESKQILTETGLDAECVKAPLIDFVRYVYLGGKLNLIPQTPLKILKAPLIPWHAKLRVLAEFWRSPLAGEPTVAKWIHHRFGPALLPYLDAVYTGTYAGDFDRLTIDSVMPGVRNLEKEYGSVLYGLIKKMREKKKSQENGNKFQMPSMTSFPDGMQTLVDRLAEPLIEGDNLLLNTEVSKINRSNGGWKVVTNRGVVTGSNLVCALPINPALRLLSALDPVVPETSVPEAWIATAVFGFPDNVTIPPGFGFLTPEVEQRFALGSLFSSNMFANRAPEGHIVFETLIGGRRHPEKVALDDVTLTQKALADVGEILKIKDSPVYTTVLRSGGGIPQLERNYPKLLRWKDTFSENNVGFHICGFGWEGIGLNDMMKSATRVAKEILSHQTNKPDAEVKGIYF